MSAPRRSHHQLLYILGESNDSTTGEIGYNEEFKFVTGKSIIPSPRKLISSIGIHRKISNIIRTLVGNKMVAHSDVVGASPAGGIFILDLTPGFNILHKGNCKTILETYKFRDLVFLILDIHRPSVYSLTKASDAELWCFLWSAPEQTVA